jgi:hypothetical protein
MANNGEGLVPRYRDCRRLERLTPSRLRHRPGSGDPASEGHHVAAVEGERAVVPHIAFDAARAPPFPSWWVPALIVVPPYRCCPRPDHRRGAAGQKPERASNIKRKSISVQTLGLLLAIPPPASRLRVFEGGAGGGSRHFGAPSANVDATALKATNKCLHSECVI